MVAVMQCICMFQGRPLKVGLRYYWFLQINKTGTSGWYVCVCVSEKTKDSSQAVYVRDISAYNTTYDLQRELLDSPTPRNRRLLKLSLISIYLPLNVYPCELNTYYFFLDILGVLIPLWCAADQLLFFFCSRPIIIQQPYVRTHTIQQESHQAYVAQNKTNVNAVVEGNNK